jgi:hypothetical protein
LANRKTVEKLKVPAEFKLTSYSSLRNWRDPRLWLDQFALRIDLLARWEKKVLPYRRPSGTDETRLMVEDFYLDEILSSIWDDPLAPVQEYLNYYSRWEVEFPTLELVKEGFDPVRRMTVLDLYLAECTVHPLTRRWGRSYGERVHTAAPYPEDALRCAQLWEDERGFLSYEPDPEESPAEQLLTEHKERIDEFVRETRFRDPMESSVPSIGDYASLLLRSLDEEAMESGFTYLAVNTNVPYKIAEASFRKQFESRQKRSCYRKRFDSAALARWCDDGILPFIDLCLFERIESGRRGASKLAITEEELASAIYRASLQRASSCVTDTTRPVAEELLNPNSSHFRSLLAEFGGPRPETD